jgi:signal transduction histidine kinase
MERVSLLPVPVFYKILLANAALVLVVASVSAALAVSLLHVDSRESVFGIFVLIAAASALVSVPLHAVILHFALAPLEELVRTAERVERGEMGARAAASPLADPKLSRLTLVFNRLLDSVAADRRRLQEVAARAFQAQETERVRLATELQGEIAQTLSALLLRMRVVRQTGDADRRAGLLDEMRDDTAELAERIRRFARTLHAPALADLGLAAAVEGYARTLSGDTGLPIDVEADDVRGALSAEGELALFRIVQEALSNVVRHADADSARIRIRRGAEWVEVEVADDGRGFSVAETQAQRPAPGLFGMRERALYAGGVVELESSPGRGTRLRARIPVTRADGSSAGPLQSDAARAVAGGVATGV